MKKTILFISIVTVLFLYQNVFAQNYPISWNPVKVQKTMGLGDANGLVTATFTSKANLKNVDVFMTPELKSFVSVQQTRFATIQKNTYYQLTLAFSVPLGAKTGPYTGTIQIKVGSTTQSMPLKIELTVVDAIKAVGPGGGTLVVTDPASPIYGTSIDIPAGALNSPKNITIIGSQYVSNATGMEGLILKLEPTGLHFNMPVKLIMPFNLNNLKSSESISVMLFDGVSYEQLEDTIIDSSRIQVHLDHFSWIYGLPVDDIYEVLHIPPAYLTPGDIIYRLSNIDGNTEYGGWHTGHVGLFAGKNYSVEFTDGSVIHSRTDTVIESNLPPFCQSSVCFTNWVDSFIKYPGYSYSYLYLGARIPQSDKLNDIARNEVVKFALSKYGYRWLRVGADPDSSTYSCVGLVEASYENADINITNDFLFGSLTPLMQFNNTIPKDKITVTVGNNIQIPVKGVINVSDDRYERYSDDSSFYEVKAINLPAGATFNDNQFNWTPRIEHAGNDFTVNFVVKAIGGKPVGQSVTQRLVISVPPLATSNSPSKPTLISPMNNSTINNNFINFYWNPSTDPNGDPIQYCITIKEDSSTEDIIVWAGCDSGLFMPNTSFQTSLNSNKKYWWAIWAKDDKNNWSQASEWWSFNTSIPLYSISGKVTGSNGQYIPGVVLTLRGVDVFATTTGPDGTYQVSGVKEGQYTLTPTFSGYAFDPVAKTLNITSNRSGENFIATPIFNLSGSIVDANGLPIEGVRIQIDGIDVNYHRYVGSLTDGSFSFSSVPQGQYTITYSIEGYTFIQSSIPVTLNENVTLPNAIATQSNTNSISIVGEDAWSATWSTTMQGSYQYTVPNGDDRVLVVAFSLSYSWWSGAMGGYATFNSATVYVNGIAMNVGAMTSHGWNVDLATAIFYLVNPPVGEVTISWNVNTGYINGTGAFIAMTLLNCDTYHPVVSASSYRNIVTSIDNALLIDAAEVAIVPPPETAGVVPGPDQTERGWAVFAGGIAWTPTSGYLVSSSKMAASAGSYEMTWDVPYNVNAFNHYYSCVVAFKPKY